MAGQDQDAERALAERDHDVAGDDHPLRRDPVRDDPADQGEDDGRRDLRGQDVREIGRGPGRVQHRERDADQRERERERGQQAIGQQQPEIAVPEHRKTAHERTRGHG